MTSAGIALGVTVLALAVSLPAGRALALEEFRGKQLVVFFLLLPVLAPPLASAMGLHALFLRLGLTDSVLGVLLVHLIPAVSYCALMLMGSFADLDTDWEAQARTLGATPREVWWHVTLPAIAPGMAVAASFAFLVSSSAGDAVSRCLYCWLHSSAGEMRRRLQPSRSSSWHRHYWCLPLWPDH